MKRSELVKLCLEEYIKEKSNDVAQPDIVSIHHFLSETHKQSDGQIVFLNTDKEENFIAILPGSAFAGKGETAGLALRELGNDIQNEIYFQEEYDITEFLEKPENKSSALKLANQIQEAVKGKWFTSHILARKTLLNPKEAKDKLDLLKQFGYAASQVTGTTEQYKIIITPKDRYALVIAAMCDLDKEREELKEQQTKLWTEIHNNA